MQVWKVECLLRVGRTCALHWDTALPRAAIVAAGRLLLAAKDILGGKG